MPSDNEDAMRLEALGDLRRCLELAEEIDDLEVVEGADPDLEIGALYEISQEKEDPPVLVFDNIKGYPPGFRVAVNVRSSRVFFTGEGLERVEMYRAHRRQSADPIDPVTVDEGPVLENVQEGDDIDTLKFPAPKWHQGDGGRYIGTECLVVTKDPDSDWVNVGTYRVEVECGICHIERKKLMSAYMRVDCRRQGRRKTSRVHQPDGAVRDGASGNRCER